MTSKVMIAIIWYSDRVPGTNGLRTHFTASCLQVFITIQIVLLRWGRAWGLNIPFNLFPLYFKENFALMLFSVTANMNTVTGHRARNDPKSRRSTSSARFSYGRLSMFCFNIVCYLIFFWKFPNCFFVWFVFALWKFVGRPPSADVCVIVDCRVSR